MAGPAATTIKAVAAAAGVSVGTVSNVLAGKAGVGSELRERVLQAVAATGYRPNAVAAQLRRRRTGTIGLCIPDLANPFFVDLMQQIGVVLERDGYGLIVMETREDEGREAAKLDTLLANRVEGVFMVPTAGWRRPQAAPAPLVVIDRVIDAESLPSVALDNGLAAERALAHLHALGHRRIWMVVNSRRLWNSRLRVAGFLAAAGRLGIGSEVAVVEAGMTPQEMAVRLADSLRAGRPTAVVTASGNATLGALRALQDLGLAVPRDVSLLGFDDVAWMEVLRPAISVLRQPVERMAGVAWAMMRAALAGAAPPERHVRLPGRIVTRESTRRLTTPVALHA